MPNWFPRFKKSLKTTPKILGSKTLPPMDVSGYHHFSHVMDGVEAHDLNYPIQWVGKDHPEFTGAPLKHEEPKKDPILTTDFSMSLGFELTPEQMEIYKNVLGISKAQPDYSSLEEALLKLKEEWDAGGPTDWEEVVDYTNTKDISAWGTTYMDAYSQYLKAVDSKKAAAEVAYYKAVALEKAVTYDDYLDKMYNTWSTVKENNYLPTTEGNKKDLILGYFDPLSLTAKFKLEPSVLGAVQYVVSYKDFMDAANPESLAPLIAKKLLEYYQNQLEAEVAKVLTTMQDAKTKYANKDWVAEYLVGDSESHWADSPIVQTLVKYIPGLTKMRVGYCAACYPMGPPEYIGLIEQSFLVDRIIHLNDKHKWTREAIADWLETLDLDLTFKFEETKEVNDDDHTDC